MIFLRKNKIKRLLLSVWAIVAALTLFVNVSYAHYEQATESGLEFSVPGTGATQIYLTDNSGWKKVSGGTEADGSEYLMGFTLTNGVSESLCASESQTVCVQVFETEGIATTTEETTTLEGEKSVLTLTVNGCTLKGVGTEVTEGSVFYKKYGPGVLYRFCSEAGEEMDWTMAGGVFSKVQMELKVENGAAGTAYVVMTDADIKGWNKDYLYARIPEDAEKTEETEYSYLTKGGQYVLLGALNDTMKIELGEGGCTVVNDSTWEKWVTAEIEGSTLILTASEPETGNKDSPEDGEESNGDLADETEESENEASDQADDTEVVNDTSIALTLYDVSTQDDEDVGEELPDDSKNELPDTDDNENGNETDDEDKSDETKEPEEPETMEICVTSSDERSVTFVLSDAPEETSGTVTLNNDQYYNPTIPIIATASADADAVLYGFPAKTKVTVGEETYILYSDDLKVTVSAGETAVFDLSDTERSEKELTIQDGGTHTLKYFALPEVSTESATVLGNTGLLLSLPYQWGTSEKPEVKIERYTKENGKFVWSAVNTIVCEAYAATGEVAFSANGAEAGSYRATLTWTDGETELLNYPFPFYVFYPEQTAGDQSVAYSYVGGQPQGILNGGEEIVVHITYYCACTECCSKYGSGYTASGKKVTSGMVAMSESYPFGTKIVIDGIVYTVEDRGSEITENDVDIYVPSHTDALKGGVRDDVTAIVYFPTGTEETDVGDQ